MTRLHPRPAPASPAQAEQSVFLALFLLLIIIIPGWDSRKRELKTSFKRWQAHSWLLATAVSIKGLGVEEGDRNMCEGGVLGAGTVPERQDKGNTTKWFRNTVSGWESRGRGAAKKYPGYKTFVSEMAQKLLSEAGRRATEDKKVSNGHEILKNSSIRPIWAETSRVSLYAHGGEAENALEELFWDARIRSWGDLHAYIIDLLTSAGSLLHTLNAVLTIWDY